MYNVICHVVLTGRDKYLGTRDIVRAIGIWLGFGFYLPKIGTALRFSQTHRTGPRTLNHFG